MSRRDDGDNRRDDGENNQRFRVGNFTAGEIALFKDIAGAAADEAVQKMFVQMGHDPQEPLTAQLDAAWTRRMRTRLEGAVGKAILTTIGLSVIGAVHALWDGIKAALASSPALPPH